jgi:nucleoside 2-deoxyribosyltransferase
MAPKLFAFVLMPFDARFDDVYRLGIKAAAEELGIVATRVDEQIFHNEAILDRIYNQIDAADIIIADMTGKNPNVFYEVGYAHAKNKTCILLTAEASDIPFDLKHKRHIIYGSSVSNLKSKLTIDLISVKDEIAARENPVSVELADIDGDLIKTKYTADAKVTIKLDMHNRTASTSPDIDAIYFYGGPDWRYRQDGHECPEAKSDIPDYRSRYLVRPPLPRLTHGGWAQIKLVGEKNIATAYSGEKLKDEYELTGRALVRIVTKRGNFDYALNLTVKISEFPF